MKRHKISALDFKRLLEGKSIKINDYITINATSEKNKNQRIFKNISVEEPILISGNYGYNLYFENNCSISNLAISDIHGLDEDRTLAITTAGNSHISFLRIQDSIPSFSISVWESSSITILKLSKVSMSSIYIKGKSLVSQLSIEKLSIERIHIKDQSKIHFAIINRETNCKYFSTSEETTVQNINICEKSVIENLTLESDKNIQGIDIQTGCRISEAKIGILQKINTLDIKDSTIDNLIVKDESKIEEWNISGNSEVHNLEFINNCRIHELSLINNAIIGNLEVNDFAYCYSTLVTDNSGILRINLKGGTIGQLRFSDCITSMIYFKGSNTRFDNGINLENLKVNSLSFQDFKINTGLQLFNVESNDAENSSIKFIRSNIGHSSFINVKLETFNFLFFSDSQISQSFLSQTRFPKRIETGMDRGTISHHRQVKLLYEQIKSIFQNQGNRTNTLEYQSLELSAYFSELSRSFAQSWKTRRFWAEEFIDWLTLCFNRHTTNFGTSWTRGFLALLVTTIPLFILLLWSTKGVVAVWPWQMNSEDFGLYTTQYFDFINPTSYIWKRWDFIYELEGGEIRWGVKLLLLFSKVLIVTIIYQIIQAFRKFGRK
ncbi:hypothetical protein [uncultured Roseivirga sp.]|uniref:hypothetical protein n=1 Tax=uncultured Roseivirga sp. TaxID=543088 RepID=UPI00258D63F7|nr:hypothetical protein [uncultured Roseivirga sp.]